MHQAMSISSPLYGMVITADHTKAENAVRLYDLEGYDDAFLREVAKVEERHSPMKSPNFLSTPQSLIQTSTQDINYSRRSLMGSFEEGKATLCRDELTPKKLDFTAALNSDIKNSYALDKDRAMKVKDWYDKMSNSNVSLPSIELLEAHGELCQEKALLVLSHFPKGGWERDLSVEELRKYKDMEMSEVDGRLCQITSCRKLSKTDWAKQKDNHIVFQCEINCEGLCAFKGPYYEQTNSALQRVFGNGGVLRVHFADHKKNSEIVEGLYRKIAREGIWVGLRHYMFFAYKDPKGKKKQGLIEDISSVPRCFFVCTDSLAFWDCINPKFRQFGSICEARRFMMHIDTVPTLAKKFARLQLALSQTWPLMDLNCPDIKVEIIEDIYCRDKWGEIVSDASGEKLIHTDGTGYVSKDIAARCPASICKGKPKVACNDEEIPLLLQVRLFHKGMVAKGTLLVNFKLPPLTIQVRKSMVKVRRDENITGLCHNSLEICATSRKPGKGKLSPYLALLLRYGGVPEEVLLKFAEEELQEILTKFKSRTAAVSALKNSDQGDHFDSAIRMLVANIPLDEPYISKTLWDLSRGHLQELSTGRVTIPDTYNLMGCADPTGKLDRNQVVIILGHGPLFCPKVLVYKSPGLHVGDVKVLEATWHREFEDIIGNGKYVIFFSVKGPRAVVDEIANSDLDGDQYWCCTNAQVVNHFRPSDVWQNPGSGNKTSTAKLYKNEELDKQHFEAYLRVRFKPSSTMGVAANSWLALMDKFLMLDEQDQGRKELWSRIQSLVNTYYEAVDAEKSGKQVSVKKEDKARYWPHYKERNQGGKSKWINDESTYNSTTVLGKIYDLVKGQWETVDFISRLEKMMSEDRFIEKRFQYPSFEIYHKTWEDHFKNYRTKMHLCMHENDGESRSSEIEALLQEYRWELYKADTLIDSPEPLEEVYKQASAIYIVVYTHAQRKIESWKEEDNGQQVVSLGLQFAWRVAAYALINIFRKNSQGKRKEPIFVEESVFRSLKFARRQKE